MFDSPDSEAKAGGSKAIDDKMLDILPFDLIDDDVDIPE